MKEIKEKKERQALQQLESEADVALSEGKDI
jgi:hypothetical protein